MRAEFVIRHQFINIFLLQKCCTFLLHLFLLNFANKVLNSIQFDCLQFNRLLQTFFSVVTKSQATITTKCIFAFRYFVQTKFELSLKKIILKQFLNATSSSPFFRYKQFFTVVPVPRTPSSPSQHFPTTQ